LIELAVSITEAKESVKVNAINVNQLRVPGGRNSSKERVINHVELWTYIPGDQVANSADGTGVLGGDSEVLSSTAARSPFGELLAILQLGVKNVARTTKNLD
jgi:hypothetical protein